MTRKPYVFTSHEDIDHDDIDSLGYDWDRAADRDVEAVRPLRVYLPETVEEVERVIGEVNRLGLVRDFRVRSRAHSSNRLVLSDRGSVLLTRYLDEVGPVEVDYGDECSVWLGAGALLARVDEMLAEQGYGLPVIGDHNHITAGGFASVGGVSPASNKRGIFLDNVLELEYVSLEGYSGRCSRDLHAETFYRLLGGTGRAGVIVRIRCRVIPIRKWDRILRNDRVLLRTRESFVAESGRRMRSQDGVLMERGLWLEYPLGGLGVLCVGQYSTYRALERPSTWARWSDRLSHGWLHALGRVAGRLPRLLDKVVQILGVIGIVVAPRYASVKNVEAFADKVVDTSVGDAHRMLIVFAEIGLYEEIFEWLHDLCAELRDRKLVSYVLMYVKSIDSPYLRLAHDGGRNADQKFCEILLYLGVEPEMTEKHLEELVERIDGMCVEKGAMRYMHTRTVGPSHPLRRKIDPNERALDWLAGGSG
jgi:FAD/FMN-containing dehydrogenase